MSPYEHRTPYWKKVFLRVPKTNVAKLDNSMIIKCLLCSLCVLHLAKKIVMLLFCLYYKALWF